MKLSSNLNINKLNMTMIFPKKMVTSIMNSIFYRKEELRCLKRTDLIDILANSLPRNTLHFGCEVLSIELDPITSSPVLQLQGGRLLNAKVQYTYYTTYVFFTFFFINL